MRFVFEKAETTIHRRTFSLAVRLERRFAPALQRALRALQARVQLAPIARAISDSDVEGVLEVTRVGQVADIIAEFEDEMAQGLRLGAEAAAASMGLKVEPPRFIKAVIIDLGRPKIAQWLHEHAAELVVQVSDSSRGAIHAVLEDGVLRGRHPTQMAKDIKQCVGLHERYANAVIRRRLTLEAQGVPQPRIQAICDSYAERLLNARAKLIARNESMVAVNRGRFELWDQLQDDGALEPGTEQRWDTADDEGVCPICGPMNGQRRKLGEAFTTGDGGMVDHPPAHVACRCVVGLV